MLSYSVLLLFLSFDMARPRMMPRDKETTRRRRFNFLFSYGSGFPRATSLRFSLSRFRCRAQVSTPLLELSCYTHDLPLYVGTVRTIYRIINTMKRYSGWLKKRNNIGDVFHRDITFHARCTCDRAAAQPEICFA